MIYFRKIGSKEDLQIVGFGGASYESDEKAIGGVILLLVNLDFTRASPIYGSSIQIERVCPSSKDAEMLNLSKLVEDAFFAARQFETLLFGEYQRKIPVPLFTNSEGTLESLASTKQVDRKSLRMTVQDLKEKLVDKDTPDTHKHTPKHSVDTIYPH